MAKGKLDTVISDIKGCLFDCFVTASDENTNDNAILRLNFLMSEAAATLNDLNRIVAEMEHIKNGSKQG